MCCCGCSLALALVEARASTSAGNDLPAGEATELANEDVTYSGFGAQLAQAMRDLPKRVGDWIMWPAHRAMRMPASAQGSTNG